MSYQDVKDVIDCIESEGFEVTNWKPGNRRLYRVLDNGRETGDGMYSNELKAWFRGYLQGLKVKGKGNKIRRSYERR